ncbi:exocyst complex component 3-like protein isoform X2 [Xenopus laevis]|uniref:Exocyst complex component 3-like protein isoform X2 n=1 Tax=Xenopus laevis TaxID=8355 RepID=A0A8J0V5R1_XENLA|nr:exocyst complex component 3-like protein isoform X2 [Xenopus laevis]
MLPVSPPCSLTSAALTERSMMPAEGENMPLCTLSNWELTRQNAECSVLALEKAESLARGAALKWASGIFSRPDQLTRLGHYRRRETQRNNSIQTRLKSAVQSYVEGVEQGIKHLHNALTEVQNVQRELNEAQEIWRKSDGQRSHLQPIRNLVTEHVQLSVVIQSLPFIYTVPELISHTQNLIETQSLLEAHRNLRDLESFRDVVLYRLQRVRPLEDPSSCTSEDEQHGEDPAELVQQFFAGVNNLSEDLGRLLFSLAQSAVSLACSNPSLLVSAVRIIEREEYLDAEDTRGSPQQLWRPPGRPKQWRESFFRALERGVCDRLIKSGLQEDITPTGLATDLKDLQSKVLDELQAVCSVLAPCVPPRYEVCRAVALMCHHAISRHVRDILGRELAHPALYRVLHCEDMMGHQDLSPEIDAKELGALLSPEILEEQLNRYTRSVKVCLAQWIQKALEVEYAEWFRKQEPDKDQDGLYLSSLQQLVMQMLAENVQLASVLGETLESRVRNAAVLEMDNCLVWLREALVKYGIEHMKDRTHPTYYILYLLAIINGCTVLSSSISYLQPEDSASPVIRKSTPCLQTSLDKTQKKACHLLLDELQTELQPLFLQIPSRTWLSGSDTMHIICEKVELFNQHLSMARAPMCQFLLGQTERMLVIEYVKAFMHSKMVCKNPLERQQMAERMSSDAEELRAALSRMDLEQSTLCVPLILSIKEIFALKDPSLLSLEVSGLMTTFPDISDDHVLALMELRGDVNRDLRHTVLNMMQQQTLTLPKDYRPIFMSISVPAPAPPFCLHPSSCA